MTEKRVELSLKTAKKASLLLNRATPYLVLRGSAGARVVERLAATEGGSAGHLEVDALEATEVRGEDDVRGALALARGALLLVLQVGREADERL
jgi:hypothetical protein